MSTSESKVPAKTPRPSGLKRQRRIIEVAAEHFARVGYTRATVAKIAAEVGVTDAGVLHHFGSKENLFNAVVAHREDAYARHDPSAATSVRDLMDRLIAGAASSADEPALLRFRAVLSGEALLEDSPASGHLRHVLETSLATLVPIVQRGIDTGELVPDTDPQQFVLEALALNEGVRGQVVVSPEVIDYIPVFTRALNRLYASVARTA
ncbi:TetR/AcrR family transcriptional regulator [Mycetocola lacteus]|uniref:TetR/AcrR family transcriptional regulator n=1 Tax=Mycetocola lacteus TaxID=76637 RepID=A0A3L7AUR4_9MICO|nr:TetR family transcriptional regulator [Mycetocola lacteus]RLP83238.1 TetR/AcrR family transcriptional regulator [Mycetocola lacteus]